MTKTTHQVDVVPVVLEPHPNADSLSIVQVYGYTVVVRTEDWVDKTQAAYLPPDSVVDLQNPTFSWLKKPRIKACRLRGVVSFGLLVPAPEGSNIGDDVAQILGVTHYDGENERGPSKPGHGGPQFMGPPVPFKYDVDSLKGSKKYGDVFGDEIVYITEKIDGENMRVVFDGKQLRVGSRSYWREAGDKFWEAVTPQMEAFCRANSGWTLFGEKYGAGRYGRKDAAFACFDVMDDKGHWLSTRERLWIKGDYGIEFVPSFGEMQYDFAKICELAEGQSTLHDGTVREGVVVEPIENRWHPRIGRVKLKVVGAGYLGVGK